MIVAMATPACAQLTPNLLGGGAQKLKTDVDVRREQERESGFQSGISKIPDAKGKVDPWGNVRAAAPPQPDQKQARPGSK
jgi:hypothetical protein